MQWSANSNISFICHCNGDVNRGQKRDVVQWVKDERECICVQFCFDLEGPEITKWKIYFRVVNNEYITKRKMQITITQITILPIYIYKSLEMPSN